MTTIQIPVEIESQIEALARRTGESKDDLERVRHGRVQMDDETD